jgi:hypothetical protein
MALSGEEFDVSAALELRWASGFLDASGADGRGAIEGRD